ncbi:MAG: hypothetical protein ACYTEZ_10640 [Planctomycetota bacterium]|jgi:hypothetical protein
MPVEQRIIGGGLLFVGIAIVLILIFLFTLGGPSAREAYEQIVSELYPNYVAAQNEGDYLGMQRTAERILKLLDEADRTAVVKLIRAEATTDRELRRLQERLEDGTFGNNVEGRYGFDGDWFEERTHRALQRLHKALTEDLKALREIRVTAREARQALAEARLGSGRPLEQPPPRTVPTDSIDPNPVYAGDAALYCAFGVAGVELEKALETKGAGAKARSARLRWNAVSPTVRSRLATAVESIPERAETLGRIAAEIERSLRVVAGDPTAAGKVELLLGKAAVLVGSGLDAPHREAFQANRARFASGSVIVTLLQNEAAMLHPYLATVRGLGQALGKKFAE